MQDLAARCANYGLHILNMVSVPHFLTFVSELDHWWSQAHCSFFCSTVEFVIEPKVIDLVVRKPMLTDRFSFIAISLNPWRQGLKIEIWPTFRRVRFLHLINCSDYIYIYISRALRIFYIFFRVLQTGV